MFILQTSAIRFVVIVQEDVNGGGHVVFEQLILLAYGPFKLRYPLP